MAGTVDGLIGGLYVGSELRSLKDWEWDVRCALKQEEGRERRTGGGDDVRKEEAGDVDEIMEAEVEEMEMEVKRGRVRDWWD